MDSLLNGAVAGCTVVLLFSLLNELRLSTANAVQEIVWYLLVTGSVIVLNVAAVAWLSEHYLYAVLTAINVSYVVLASLLVNYLSVKDKAAGSR